MFLLWRALTIPLTVYSELVCIEACLFQTTICLSLLSTFTRTYRYKQFNQHFLETTQKVDEIGESARVNNIMYVYILCVRPGM